MKLPNLLATKGGRLTAFFALYMTEGIPLGFTGVAIATQMRREGLGPAEIGAFVGSLYTPWAFKWLAGPFVDVFSSDRFGRRRAWIIAMQLLMIAALMAALPINFSTELTLFTWVIYLHNAFCATQDVAIDALAVNTLSKQERGLACGLMFAGASVGQAMGGAGVLKLIGYTGWNGAYYLVGALLLSVTVFVALPMREPAGPPRPHVTGSRLRVVGKELKRFGQEAVHTFTTSRGALLGLVFAILPSGAYALANALQTTLSVDLGMSDSRIADLSFTGNVVGGAGCIIGGWLSDKLGRRRMLALFIASMSLPTLYLAWSLYEHGWIMPLDAQATDRPVPPAILVTVLWITTIAYMFCNGLMYGARAAFFMDITNPVVAATQFTAYMSCLNLVINYSNRWQGVVAEHWGYPTTLVIDSVVGLLPLVLLLFINPKEARGEQPPPLPASTSSAP